MVVGNLRNLQSVRFQKASTIDAVKKKLLCKARSFVVVINCYYQLGMKRAMLYQTDVGYSNSLL